MKGAVETHGPLTGVQRWMIGHAALILLIGMLAGVGLLVSLLGGVEVWRSEERRVGKECRL